jgi:hypothetical protein
MPRKCGDLMAAVESGMNRLQANSAARTDDNDMLHAKHPSVGRGVKILSILVIFIY